MTWSGSVLPRGHIPLPLILPSQPRHDEQPHRQPVKVAKYLAERRGRWRRR